MSNTHSMITGKQFNDIYNTKRFIKLTNKECNYTEFSFKEGLNEDKQLNVTLSHSITLFFLPL